MSDLSTSVQIVVATFLVLGSIFAFIGSYGLAKLGDFYMRLHAPTKASTLGLGGILFGSTVFFSVSQSTWSLHELLITLFLFITAPVSAHLLAKTALHKRFEYVGGQPDPLDHPLNVKTVEPSGLVGRDEDELPDDEDFPYVEDEDEDEEAEKEAVEEVAKADEDAEADETDVETSDEVEDEAEEAAQDDVEADDADESEESEVSSDDEADEDADDDEDADEPVDEAEAEDESAEDAEDESKDEDKES